MIKELVQQLNAVGEASRVEAKTAAGAGESALETVCAFSNEPGLGGGHILLGVRREDMALFPTYEVVGVADPERLQADMASQCASVFNFPVRPRFTTEVVDGKVVVCATVPELDPSQKPLYLKARGLPGGAYRRIGEADVRCTEDDLLVFYQSRSRETFDGAVCEDATLDDIDPAQLQEYRRLREQASPTAEELGYDDADLLLALGCAKGRGAAMRPTVAGVVLFGKQMSLRRLFPMLRVDYIRVSGKEWVRDPERRFEGSVDMRDPLFRLARRIQAQVNDDLPEAFSLPDGALQRTPAPAIPSRVIREAVVNAVMHRSYRANEPIQIIRYSNRLEIRNPGYSLKSEERFGEPGSESRNPRIAAVLHDTNFAETKGSGIRAMRQQMQNAGLTPPFFESDRVGDRFVATFLFHHFLSAEDLDWLSHFQGERLSDEEARALVFTREVGAISNAAYRSTNQVDALGASASLRRLRDVGLLEAKGRGAGTYYVPTARLLDPRPHKGNGTAQNDNDLAHIEMRASHIDMAPAHIDSDAFIKSLSPSAQLSLANVRDKGRVAPEAMRMAIRGLCEARPMSATALAGILGRSRVYLLTTFIQPMVEEGLLAPQYPDMPSHPNQAYGAVRPDQPPG